MSTDSSSAVDIGESNDTCIGGTANAMKMDLTRCVPKVRSCHYKKYTATDIAVTVKHEAIRLISAV